MEGHNFRKEIIIKLHQVRIDLFSNLFEDLHQKCIENIEEDEKNEKN